ncbi:MAG: hypothetical protein HY550_08155, partial [Elusimicrobia bacterium]|nr:hypothetical protein [Elusimicrobiota bacterium]
ASTVRVETEARNKTTFHLLLAPLYPFFSPGARESGLLRQMLWRSATDVYARLKAAGVPAGALPPRTPLPGKETPAISAPPVEPDRTWLPGQPLENTPPVPVPAPAPEKPDQSWAVPPGQDPAPAAPAPDEPLDD